MILLLNLSNWFAGGVAAFHALSMYDHARYIHSGVDIVISLTNFIMAYKAISD